LEYAEDHPDEVLQVIEHRAEADFRELERKHREADRASRRKGGRPRYTPEELAAVPF
jgi:hypothetical protein